MDWRPPLRLIQQAAHNLICTPCPSTRASLPGFGSPAYPRYSAVRSFASTGLHYHDATFTKTDGPKSESSRHRHGANEGSKSETTKSDVTRALKRARQKKRVISAKAPLAKVAQDAEVSHLRGLVHGSSRSRDPRVKHVTASCVAEEYDLSHAQQLLQRNGITIGPCGTILYPEEPQVIHAEMPFTPDFHSNAPDTSETVKTGDVFIFPSGVLVAWGVPAHVVAQADRILRPAARKLLGENSETEDLEYLEDQSESRTAMRGEKIVLGMKSAAGESSDGAATDQKLNGEVRTVLAKIAFSSGLARATKLSVLENQVDDYAASTRAILEALRGGGRGPGRFQLRSRAHIYGAIAQLLDLRAQLNLYSDLTDDLPDLLWDTRSELRMENYYDQVGKVLDTAARIKSLNQKMDYSANIVHTLRDMRSEIHSSFLEKIIILLIGFEISLVLWTEYRAQSSGGELQQEKK